MDLECRLLCATYTTPMLALTHQHFVIAGLTIRPKYYALMMAFFERPGKGFSPMGVATCDNKFQSDCFVSTPHVQIGDTASPRFEILGDDYQKS